MPVWSEPGQRWRLLLPPDATVVADGGAVPAAGTVALTGPRRRVHARARAAGIAVEREYAALPSLGRPVLVVALAPGPLAWATRAVLTVPPGVTRRHAAYSLLIRLVRAWPGLLGLLPVEHVVVGRRV